MTKFGDWIRGCDLTPIRKAIPGVHDLAGLCAQLEEELNKRRNPGNPHLRESDHAGDGGCPQECLDFRAALTACEEFMDRHD